MKTIAPAGIESIYEFIKRDTNSRAGIELDWTCAMQQPPCLVDSVSTLCTYIVTLGFRIRAMILPYIFDSICRPNNLRSSLLTCRRPQS